MMRFFRRSAFVAIGLFGMVFAYQLLTSREESMLAVIYETFFGPPDMGPIDFETFARSAKPNTALACPPGFCRNAKADFDPGVFPGSDEELRERFTRFVLSEPDVVPVYRHASPGLPTQDRYVQRTRLMRFPDTINVRFIALSDTTSTLAIHSSSQMGYSDLGVNLARIRRWVENPQVRGK